MDLFELSATIGLNTKSFMSGLDLAGQAFGAFADFVIGFSKDVLETGLGFDKAMGSVQAVLGREEGTVENMNKLRQFAMEQARKSIFTTEEAADAYYYMGMAGWKSEQMQAGLPGIMALAAASGEDLARVSDIVTDSITAFGLTADDVTKYVDILAQTATNANTDVSRMGETFKYVAPVAGALGYDVEDVAITIGLLADAGIKGSMAGTTLRNIFTRIATNAGSTQKDLGALEIMTRKLGVSFYDSEDKVRPWLEVLTEARKSWQGLSDAEMQEAAATFGTINAEVADSNTLFSQFNEDAKDIKDTIARMNALSPKTSEYSEQREKLKSYYDTYRDLLVRLGVNIKDVESGHMSMSDAFDQARIKLGGLTDQEAIYYAKQIASMRGMSGWLTLMNMSNEEVQKLTESIQNATGAAQWMADTRLDNLPGDIEYFKSELNDLKTSLYDNVKDPLREVVQEGTNGLHRITDAIQEDGIIGGLKQLSTELKNIKDNETFKEFVSAASEALVEIGSLLPKLGIDFVGAAYDLGSSFAGGLMNGVTQKLEGTAAGNFLFDTKNKGIGAAIGNAIFGGGDYSDPSQYIIPLKADVQVLPDPESLGFTKDEVTGIYSKAGEEGGKEMMDNVAAEVAKSVVNGVGKPTRSALSDAGRDGGADMTANVSDRVTQDAPGIGDILSAFIGNSGDSAGSTFATLFGNILGNESYGMRNDLESVLGDAGSGAGWDIARDIQSALNFANFTVKVVGVVSQVINTVRSIFSHNASAMSSGRIYTKPTVFGYYDNAYQVAGDAGPEAVVGVNSLQRMITNAVHSAGAGQEVVVPRNQSRDLTVILELDRQQMGKMVYKLNNEEAQRVGVRLSRGGAY